MMDNFRLMLAPMENVTSGALRTLCYRHGADLTFTEMVRVGALSMNNKSTWSRLEFRDATPVVIQLIGSKEEHFAKFLSMFKPQEGFSGFNINLGCPSPDIVNLGQGCAMGRKISKVMRIVGIFKDRGFPVSLKMRLGMNQRDKEYKVYLKMIEAVDADYFIVHARHGTQTYNNPADFSVYEECVRTGKEIIANGDITTKEQLESLQKIGVKGAMIGRAAVTDPAIFDRLKGRPAPPVEALMDEYVSLSVEYNESIRCKSNILKHMGKPEERDFE